MAITSSSLKSIPVSYATVSIGFNKPHSLPTKLEAISSAGFAGIELAFPDLLTFSVELLKREVKEDDYDSLCEAGEEVNLLCQKHNLKIIVLQPFSNFEGWPEGSKERKDAFSRAAGWIRIMQAVGTDLLQVGSSDSPPISTDVHYLAADLRALSDLLQPHNFRLAYENWCWATACPTWRSVWEVVQLVDRPNVGLCLDTFQTAGSEFADPRTEDGLIAHHGDEGLHELKTTFEKSLSELSKEVPADKIFFFQISDAYLPSPRIEDKIHEGGMRPRGWWSHSYRPLPFEGGYLPVVDVTKAVLETGFRGWFSTEVFDGGRDGKGKDESEESDLKAVARRAMKAHEKLMEEVVKEE